MASHFVTAGPLKDSLVLVLVMNPTQAIIETQSGNVFTVRTADLSPL